MLGRRFFRCSLVPLLAALALFGQLAQGQTGSVAASTPSITLSSMKYIFAFGDSYTANGYNPSKSLTRNLTQLGGTSANGFNWLQYLALNNPPTNNSYFDLAAFGATVNGTLVKDNNVTVPSFIDQVGVFQRYFVPAPSSVKWQSNNTLFTLWFGINDIGFSYINDYSFPEILPQIGASYNAMISILYAAGARNFLILGVPPTQRTPLIMSFGDDAVDTVSNSISLFNVMLANYATSFTSLFPGANLVLFDTQPIFNALLDEPYKYGLTDAVGTCDDYINVDLDPLVNLPSCPWPFDQYFWKNDYHPTWVVHQLLADVVAKQLTPDVSPANATSIPTTSPSVTSPATASRTSTTLTTTITTNGSTLTATLITAAPPPGQTLSSVSLTAGVTSTNIESVNSVIAGRPTTASLLTSSSSAPPSSSSPASAAGLTKGEAGGGWGWFGALLGGVAVLL
ncbi:hypothetical protein BCR35DRAFT_283930 [Leucosporidium creatinivorum]|uniref:GDSL lipase/esterase n=1 Tax=Leucosporidium creatinivorum TaxID=106004 RepID=A0A1Y2DEJ2_9BASI|nr:hypothetical protein BCR35DRAFT_283930 [Leucosporidium creatinivorum]